MTVPEADTLSADPRPSTSFVTFGEALPDKRRGAATINYDVGLPNALSFTTATIIPLPADMFLPTAKDHGVTLEELGVVNTSSGKPILNTEELRKFFESTTPKTAVPDLNTAAATGVKVAKPRAAFSSGLLGSIGNIGTIGTGGTGGIALDQMATVGPGLAAILTALPPGVWARMLGHDDLPRKADDVEARIERREKYFKELADKQAAEVESENAAGRTAHRIVIPVPGVGGTVQTTTAPLLPDPVPTIAIVETWQVTSFLGDYGLGQTVAAESMMPGERKTISVQTWAADTSRKEQATSVFDSVDDAALTRYTDGIANNWGTDRSQSASLATSVGTGMDVGIPIEVVSLGVNLDTGMSSTYQLSRQDFAHSLSTHNEDHAHQVNSARRTQVGEVTEQQREEGTIRQTTRELSNTNLRRVLNFVFRELNQTYEAVTSLRDVKLVFFNGRVGSADAVNLAGIRRFLEKYLQAGKIDEVARQLLSMLVECVDENDQPQTMLEVGTRAGGTFDWQDATLDEDGQLAFTDSPLDPLYTWRVKPGPIAQDATDDHRVPGVVTGRKNVVLRTNTVVVEALLGEADALDPYASALQDLDLRARAADLEARETDNRRICDALDLIGAITDVDKKVQAWTAMLGARPQVDVTATLDGARVPGMSTAPRA
jgi:hypothetical protein